MGWAGVTLLSLFCILMLLLFWPVTLAVRLEGGRWAANLRLLIFRFDLLPQKPEKKKKRPPEPDKPASKKRRAKSGVKTLVSDRDMIREMLPPAGRLLRRLLRRIKLRIRLRLVVSRADAGETGKTVGHIWAAVGALTPVVCRVFRVVRREISVLPDFAGELRGKSRVDCSVTIAPAVILSATVIFLINFLAAALKRRGRADRREG